MTMPRKNSGSRKAGWYGIELASRAITATLNPISRPYMNFVKFLYRQSDKLLLLATVSAVLAGLSGAALVAIISEAVTHMRPDSSTAIAFFGCCMGYLVCKSCAESSLLHITQSAVYDLRVSLSHRLLATPLKKLQELGKHRLLAILTRDVDTFIYAFQQLPVVFGNVIVIMACLAYMAWLSWQIFAMFAATLTVGVYVYSRAEQLPLKQLMRVREQLDTLYQQFRNLIEGSKELLLNAQRGKQFVEQVITPAAGESKHSFVRAMSGYIWVQNVGTLLFYLVIGVVLFVLPSWLAQPRATMTTVTFVLLYLIRPISEMMLALPSLRSAVIALERIQQLNDNLKADDKPQAGMNPFARPAGTLLALQGVAHHYPAATEDSQFMLGPFDLTINAGELLFVVGGNGCGKTTLAMLLLGLYEPEQGTIRLNDVVVTPENLDQYRQYFSAVFAEFHLFEELCGSESDALLMQAEDYIKTLQMSHKVKVVGGKFSTTDLSSGQRKRLALVSAYLDDRPIYLFDEWASDQDPVFKRVFYTKLLPDLKAKGKTVIVITHDDAYFHCADRIIKLEDGRIKVNTMVIAEDADMRRAS
jgi:putative ATP-binding cassette transporter